MKLLIFLLIAAEIPKRMVKLILEENPEKGFQRVAEEFFKWLTADVDEEISERIFKEYTGNKMEEFPLEFRYRYC